MMLGTMITKLLLVVLFAIVINLPLGYWREGLRKFSLLWLVAIHGSIPLVIAFRYAIGLTYSKMPITVTAPIIIGSAVAGQIIGSRVRRRKNS